MLTTWPAFAEAMYLAGSHMGWQGQSRLWQLVHTGLLAFSPVSAPLRVAELMERYRDVPMDLADGTLVALAEERGHRRIFTLDGDFFVYRLENGRALDVVPGPLPSS
jgi:uncharacterized protein